MREMAVMSFPQLVRDEVMMAWAETRARRLSDGAAK
jgi:hypothetical protein